MSEELIRAAFQGLAAIFVTVGLFGLWQPRAAFAVLLVVGILMLTKG